MPMQVETKMKQNALYPIYLETSVVEHVCPDEGACSDPSAETYGGQYLAPSAPAAPARIGSLYVIIQIRPNVTIDVKSWYLLCDKYIILKKS